MSDEPRNERLTLIREARQRLESLGRAGIDRIPAPPIAIAIPVAPQPAPAVPEPTPPAPTPEPPARPTLVTKPPVALAASLFDQSDAAEPPIDPAERPALLAALEAEVAVCTRCPILASTRTRTVFGEGSPTARLMFIGEAPGAQEDRTGRPFVGPAGALLTDMITKGMGLAREDVFIANILKSRPPENRDPMPDEVAHCLPYLERQIAIIRPEFLCLLGRISAQTLLETALPMSRLRGKWQRYRGIPTIVTYHPAYLLRTPTAKKDAWQDLQMLMQAMGIVPPSRKKG